MPKLLLSQVTIMAKTTKELPYLEKLRNMTEEEIKRLENFVSVNAQNPPTTRKKPLKQKKSKK